VEKKQCYAGEQTRYTFGYKPQPLKRSHSIHPVILGLNYIKRQNATAMYIHILKCAMRTFNLVLRFKFHPHLDLLFH